MSAPRANWFTDLQFHWDASITVRASGVRITLRDLTAGELAKFFAYLGVVLLQGARARLSPGRKYRVWFTPSRPRPWYVVWSAVTLCGARIARAEADADVVFYFEDVTVGTPPALRSGQALNGGCHDISKSRVACAFAASAGYPLALDPANHVGVAVEKSEENGKHDGRLLTCPTQAQPGKVYQRLVDSSDGDTAIDFRTMVINRKPVCVLMKTKPLADRFSIHNTTVTFKRLDEVFSPSEQALIARFAEEMKLDWAALDILRDRETQRIYIVDVNKTDTGPAVDLGWVDREKLKTAISVAFESLIRERALQLSDCGGQAEATDLAESQARGYLRPV
ncbi:MAG: hypothetical protein SGJ21_16580 [Alphaproteobacteria bacterium]|nr:hypothetical protein [Alphaproteobacteria bacterium]